MLFPTKIFVQFNYQKIKYILVTFICFHFACDNNSMKRRENKLHTVLKLWRT